MTFSLHLPDPLAKRERGKSGQEGSKHAGPGSAMVRLPVSMGGAAVTLEGPSQSGGHLSSTLKC